MIWDILNDLTFRLFKTYTLKNHKYTKNYTVLLSTECQPIKSSVIITNMNWILSG